MSTNTSGRELLGQLTLTEEKYKEYCERADDSQQCEDFAQYIEETESYNPHSHSHADEEWDMMNAIRLNYHKNVNFIQAWIQKSHPDFELSDEEFVYMRRFVGPLFNGNTNYSKVPFTERQIDLIEYCRKKSYNPNSDQIRAAFSLMEQGVPASMAINLTS